jgi:hypothetical protein
LGLKGDKTVGMVSVVKAIQPRIHTNQHESESSQAEAGKFNHAHENCIPLAKKPRRVLGAKF